MKKSSLSLISLLALTGCAFGQSAASVVSGPTINSGTHQSYKNSQSKNLVLCTYELCQLDEEGKLKISPVAAGSTSAIVAQASVPDAEKYLVFYPEGEGRNPNARRILRNRYLVTLAEGANLDEIKQRCGMKSLKLVRTGSNLALCEEESAGKVLSQLTAVLSDPGIVATEPLFARKRFARAVPTDPFYDTIDNDRDDGNYQWYLNNIGVNGGVQNVDINFESALDRNVTGDGVTVAVVDDGLAFDHADLVANTAVGPHLNLLDGDPADPATLDNSLNHGTNIAGLIGASFNNGEGISGVAPEVELSGIRLLGGVIDDADEAAALSFSNDIIDVYNNSWGPDDTTLDFEGPGNLTLAALQAGAEDGRGGNGVVYVWAGGDGGLIGDNSNYDGYANSKYTIAVGSVDDAGRRAPYSERGSNLIVVAPSDGGEQPVLTTSFGLGVDQDDNPIRTTEYDATFGGTSASAALVSGVVALMLEQNPDLTWRDVQDILIRTANRENLSDDGEWIENAAGFQFNHSYGAGLVDAAAAVVEAFTVGRPGQALLGPAERQVRSRFFANDDSDPFAVSGVIPDNTGGSLLVSFDMSVDDLGNPATNLQVEHVELRATVITQNRGELEVVLVSPNGTQSILQEVAPDHDEQSIRRWTFMTVRNWGEGSAGTWVLRITDRETGNVAVLNNASLVINGTADPDAPVTQNPVLTSSPLITLDQGSAFVYNLETSGATSVVVGDLPAGIVFDEAASTISGTPTTPGLFTVPVVLVDELGNQGDFRINIVVRPTAVALGDAVGFPGVPAVFGGDFPWDFELTDTNDGDDPEPRSARSAVGLNDNQSSIFGFDNLPAGVLLFDWKTSSEEGADRLWVNRGGLVPQVWDSFISGERQWARSAIELPELSNNIRWIYSKNATETGGEDRGLVDNVVFFTQEKWAEELAGVGVIRGFDPEFDSRMIFYPKVIDFGGGISQSVLASPSIGNGQTASISAWVEGPGTFDINGLLFSEPGDVFEQLLDGVVVLTKDGAVGNGQGGFSNIGGFPDPNSGRRPDSLPIPEGRHRIELRFRKNFTGTSTGTFAGEQFEGILLSEVIYTPDSSFNGFASQYGPGFDVSPDADIDGDGYTNHQEYAFGGNLIVADIPRNLPKLVEDGDRSYIEYGIDTSRTDLDYTAQQSSDLVSWGPAQLASLVRTEGDVEIYRIPYSSGPGRGHLFYRVQARTK